MRHAIIAVLLLAALAGTAVAGPFEDGESAYQRGDYAAAASWYRRAAEQSHAGGQLKLAFMYANGRGVPQDYAEAASWYRLAAEQGDAEAQYNLGFMYGNGEGVPQDDAEAAKWYRLAAEQGHAVGQLSLGNMYKRGQGVSQDNVQAYKWFNLAGAQGLASATENLDKVAKSMTPAQIAEAEKLAREWKPNSFLARRPRPMEGG